MRRKFNAISAFILVLAGGWFMPLPAEAATVKTSIIRQDGTGDYTSLAAWEAAQNKNLVTANEIAVARIEGNWPNPDTTPLIIDGWTTDAEHYIKIYTAPEARHQGRWDKTKYRLEVTNNNGIYSKEDNIRIDGLQISITRTTFGNSFGIFCSNYSNGETHISNNIIRNTNTSTNSTTGILFSTGMPGSSPIAKIWNNIVYDFIRTGHGGTGIALSFSGLTAYLYNNTVYNSYYGINASSGTVIAKNNLVQGSIYQSYYGTFNPASDYNLSDDTGTTGGNHDKASQSVTFKDLSGRDLHLLWEDTSAKDAGIDLSADAGIAFSDDIDNELRYQPWDIGADEAPVEKPEDTEPPTVPQNLVTTNISAYQVNFSWNASTDDTGMAGYRIYRCQGSDWSNPILIGTSVGPAYTDNNNNLGLNPQTAYTYKVGAYDLTDKESQLSEPLTVTTRQPYTYYVALSGNDVTGDGSEANPFATLQKAFTVMAGGDTLIIEDGNYTSSANTIDSTHFPPSGFPGRFTVIKARNIPGQEGVPVNQPLKVKFSGNAKFHVPGDGTGSSSYVKFWGIRWDGILTHTGWNHLYFKQVASQGVEDGNSATITINGQYNLLEDVVAFGKGRYKILFYDISREQQANGPGNNLARRCVIRHDWALRDDDEPGPIAGFSSYYNRGTAVLNSIVIDSDTPSEWGNDPTDIPGAYAQVVDEGPHSFIVKGCLAINTAMAAYNNRQGSSGHIIQDLVAVKVAGGLGLQGVTNAERITLSDIGTDIFTYRSDTQKSTVLTPDDGFNSFRADMYKTAYNVIIRDTLDDGVDGSNFTSDYINMFQIGGAQYEESTPAAHFYTTDPFSNGLKYPVRIEAGSTLSTQGSNGTQIGARIVNRLGKDGTFKGDTDWDTEQGPLWPWPLEDWVKAEMRTSEYTTDAKRGFCADYDQFGKPQTLTRYIWQYLGNEIPAEIYGTLKGDLNGDNEVSIADIQLCIKVILNQLDPTEYADITQKAKELAAPYDAATIKDIQEIIGIILGG